MIYINNSPTGLSGLVIYILFSFYEITFLLLHYQLSFSVYVIYYIYL